MVMLLIGFVGVLLIFVLLLESIETSRTSRPSRPSYIEYMLYWTPERVQHATEEELKHWIAGRIPMDNK